MNATLDGAAGIVGAEVLVIAVKGFLSRGAFALHAFVAHGAGVAVVALSLVEFIVATALPVAGSRRAGVGIVAVRNLHGFALPVDTDRIDGTEVPVLAFGHVIKWFEQTLAAVGLAYEVVAQFLVGRTDDGLPLFDAFPVEADPATVAEVTIVEFLAIPVALALRDRFQVFHFLRNPLTASGIIDSRQIGS